MPRGVCDGLRLPCGAALAHWQVLDSSRMGAYTAMFAVLVLLSISLLLLQLTPATEGAELVMRLGVCVSFWLPNLAERMTSNTCCGVDVGRHLVALLRQQGQHYRRIAGLGHETPNRSRFGGQTFTNMRIRQHFEWEAQGNLDLTFSEVFDVLSYRFHRDGRGFKAPNRRCAKVVAVGGGTGTPIAQRVYPCLQHVGEPLATCAALH